MEHRWCGGVVISCPEENGLSYATTDPETITGTISAVCILRFTHPTDRREEHLWECSGRKGVLSLLRPCLVFSPLLNELSSCALSRGQFFLPATF